MHRQTEFKPSIALYAVDLKSLTRTQIGTQATLTPSTGELKDPNPLYLYEISACWYRRRKGVNSANIGVLWDHSPIDYSLHSESVATGFLASLSTCLYGPRIRTRWDGNRLWNDPAILLSDVDSDYNFLSIMLENYPKIPNGFDGWWRF